MQFTQEKCPALENKTRRVLYVVQNDKASLQLLSLFNIASDKEHAPSPDKPILKVVLRIAGCMGSKCLEEQCSAQTKNPRNLSNIRPLENAYLRHICTQLFKVNRCINTAIRYFRMRGRCSGRKAFNSGCQCKQRFGRGRPHHWRSIWRFRGSISTQTPMMLDNLLFFIIDIGQWPLQTSGFHATSFAA